jgi:lysozyme family protein
MAYTFDQTKAGYAKLWDQAKLSHPAQAQAQAQRILASRATLTQVEQETGVPWFMVGALLYRESDLDFGTYLGNGQSLKRVTTVVPAGRGPFSSFVDGAVDAIKLEGMYKIGPWTLELILYWTERFNGQGYFGHGNSPYLWSWTDQYISGKFVADHVYDPNVVDVQGGCAAILMSLFSIDASLMPPRIAAGAPPVATTPTTTVPVPAGIDLAQITKTLETVVSFLPTIAMFFPPLAVAVPFVPVIEGVLKLIEDLESAPHDPQAIIAIIVKHLQDMQTNVKATGVQMQQVQSAQTPGGSTTTGG